MRPSAGWRAALLAVVALAAIAGAVAVTLKVRHHSTLPAAAGDWTTALAAPYTPRKAKSACGIRVRRTTTGVAHPVLPCGVKLYIEYGGRQVLTRVVDRAHPGPGHEFDLTPKLAAILHVEGTKTIRWRYVH